MNTIQKNVLYLVIPSLVGLGGSICDFGYARSVKHNHEVDTTMNITFAQVCIDDSIKIVETIENMMSKGLDKYNVAKVDGKINALYKANECRVSVEGKEMIKSFESCTLTAYMLKGEHLYTIGYGHVIQPNEDTPHHINKRKADELFDNDIKIIEGCVRNMLGKLDDRFTYTQGFVDGLASLVYNCGQAGVEKTSFWQRMEACRYDKTINNINVDDLKYAIAAVKTANISRLYKKGHTRRRNEEHKIMSK